jgi:predicted amidophosphoribosyltransferase
MVCTVCQRQEIDGVTHPVCKTRYTIDGVFPSLVYKGVVKKLIYVFKYPPYLTDLQSQLGDLLYEGIIQKEQFFALLQDSSVFVPIPLYQSKFRKRGYNQAAFLAKGLAKRLEIPVVDCLNRAKNTQTQVKLTKEERQKNIADAVALKEKNSDLVKNSHHVFLVGDIRGDTS